MLGLKMLSMKQSALLLLCLCVVLAVLTMCAWLAPVLMMYAFCELFVFFVSPSIGGVVIYCIGLSLCRLLTRAAIFLRWIWVL